MSSTTGRIVTKAAVAAAVVGGGAIAVAGHASAAEPVPPSPWDQLGAQLGPKVIDFINGLKPVDDPNTAEVVANQDGASGTAYQGDGLTFGQSSATPTSAKVTVLKVGDHDLLTKEGDEDGGHWAGEWAPLGNVIDWANGITCPSGHNSDDLCLTVLDASATTHQFSEDEPVDLTLKTSDVLNSQSWYSKLPSSAKTLIGTLVPPTVTASGQAEGTTTDNQASFDLLKLSKGGDSIALLPTAAHSGSYDLGKATLTTEPFTIQKFKLGPLTLGPFNVPAFQTTSPDLPRTCFSSSNAAVLAGEGQTLGPIAAFFGTPKDASYGDLGLGGSAGTTCEAPVVV